MPAMRPFRATATCAEGSSPSSTSLATRAKSASSFSESTPTLSGLSANRLRSGMSDSLPELGQRLLVEMEHGRLDGDPRVTRHRLGEPHVAADHRAFADHGVAAEDRRVRVDRDVVLQRRMALLADVEATALVRERGERHAVVELDAIADHARLADHDAGAMVDEEVAADRGAGVDVDARRAVGVL